MSFTKANIAKMESAMKEMAGALLASTEVQLYKGPTVNVLLYVGTRRSSSPELTGGIDQEGQRATIDADDWDAQAGRPPQMGDIIVWAGRRFAVQSAQLVAPTGENRVWYKANLRG